MSAQIPLVSRFFIYNIHIYMPFMKPCIIYFHVLCFVTRSLITPGAKRLFGSQLFELFVISAQALGQNPCCNDRSIWIAIVCKLSVSIVLTCMLEALVTFTAWNH